MRRSGLAAVTALAAVGVGVVACDDPPPRERAVDTPTDERAAREPDPFANWEIPADHDIRTFDPELLGDCFIVPPDDPEFADVPFGTSLGEIVSWVVVEPDGPVPGVAVADDGTTTLDLAPLGSAPVGSWSEAVVDRVVAERVRTAADLGAEVYLGLAERGDVADPATLITAVAVLDGQIAPFGNCAYERERPEFERAADSLGIEADELVEGLADGSYAVADVPYWAADVEP